MFKLWSRRQPKDAEGGPSKGLDLGLADLIVGLYVLGICLLSFGLWSVYAPAGPISLGIELILTAVWLRR